VSALAIDLAGNAWVIGSTPSPDFPVTQAAFKSRASVNNDDFVGFATKLSPAGDRVVYSTFVGGSWRSSANAIAIEASGGAVIVGSTCSPDFPVTANALQHKPGRGGGRGLEPCDGYVSKLDPSGSRAMYATYLGGIDADSLNAVALNDQSEAVVAGWTRSPDLLGTTSRGESDGLVALLGPQGNLVWIRRFGGSGADWFSSVVTGGDGTILAAGISDSTDLPCSGPLPQRPYGFVLAFRGAADDPVCSRFAGQPAAMALDDKGHVYVAGSIPFGGRTTGFVLRLTLTGRHIDWYRGTDVLAAPTKPEFLASQPDFRGACLFADRVTRETFRSLPRRWHSTQVGVAT
jgi:hypothetical protein